jgi:hypothetical protein
MPRREVYWKNSDKYRQQSREYRRRYVPRSGENNTFGNNMSNVTLGLEEVKKVLERYYSKRYIPKKLRRMEELGQVFLCDGYAFMPLSSFSKAYSNNLFSTLSNSLKKGEEGVLGFIAYIESCYPTSEGYMIYTNPVTEKGVDFLITKNGVPSAVLELTNYGRGSFLHSREIQRYIQSLNEWSERYPNIFKVIVVRYPENIKNNPQWKDAYCEFLKNGIGVKITRQEFYSTLKPKEMKK